MKISHRRTLWQHTLFSTGICGILIALVIVRRNVPTTILSLLLICYVVGNAVLHIKRNDFKKETLYEYTLMALAVFIVLASAMTH